jgi:mannose/fructose-specific phosphotransferase system component IIA
MTTAPKRPRYFLDIDPGVRNRVKAVAALKGKTMKEWLTEAIIAKLEDEIDAADGLAALADTVGSMSLEAYLKSGRNKVNKPQ